MNQDVKDHGANIYSFQNTLKTYFVNLFDEEKLIRWSFVDAWDLADLQIS